MDIRPIRSNTSEFDFQLSHPSGQLSTLVQGIWSASVPEANQVNKRLYSDGGSGIIFMLDGEAKLDDKVLPHGVILLPINRQAENILLRSGTKIAGIRFHPAIGYGVLGQHFLKPTHLQPDQDTRFELYALLGQLRSQDNIQSHITILYAWAEKYLSFHQLIPESLRLALQCLEQDHGPSQLSENTELSQRQIERLFKTWLGMTPKYYQRILRTKKAVSFLKQHKSVSLVDVALQFGFSDQAHMTREFRTIATTTPGQL